MYLPKGKKAPDIQNGNNSNSNPLPNPIGSANEMLIPYEAWKLLLCVCVQ